VLCFEGTPVKEKNYHLQLFQGSCLVQAYNVEVVEKIVRRNEHSLMMENLASDIILKRYK
jgi:hypothetical protein